MKMLLDTISCYFTIFNFIYTTRQRFNDEFLAISNRGKLSAKYLSDTFRIFKNMGLLSGFFFHFLPEQLLKFVQMLQTSEILF